MAPEGRKKKKKSNYKLPNPNQSLNGGEKFPPFFCNNLIEFSYNIVQMHLWPIRDKLFWDAPIL